uniref:AlNc14C419G11510 protein n=1 Tax=Albugo laibachii Nc14 TaxID=890382 RepID=F0WZA5_9STRA|nr:AlNc14C419G11510 [Albugo laibachii Nc14]|eukprot:CCA26823.1 AlNc14C419G11510 [Albugo laibachii Nc14]
MVLLNVDLFRSIGSFVRNRNVALASATCALGHHLMNKYSDRLIPNCEQCQIDEFLDQTGLNLPLEKSNKFFYQHHTALETDISTSNIRHLHGAYQAPKSKDVLKIIHAVRKYESRPRISSLEEFEKIVAKWTAIPPDFADVCWNAEMTSRDDLVRWISDRLKGMSMESTAGELVEWIVGLLCHPEFSRPDALAAELEEFLVTQTAEFILSLWQFIILKAAKQFVFYVSLMLLQRHLKHAIFFLHHDINVNK